MSQASAIHRSPATDFRLGILLVAGSAVFKGGADHYAVNIEAIRRAALIARGEMV